MPLVEMDSEGYRLRPEANLMSPSETLSGIAEIVSAIAQVDPAEVTPDKTFTELGLDSLAMLEAVVAFEDRFGMLVPDDDWPQFQTVGDAIQYIERAAVPFPMASA
jgi:acyl carrier protein